MWLYAENVWYQFLKISDKWNEVVYCLYQTRLDAAFGAVHNYMSDNICRYQRYYRLKSTFYVPHHANGMMWLYIQKNVTGTDTMWITK